MLSIPEVEDGVYVKTFLVPSEAENSWELTDKQKRLYMSITKSTFFMCFYLKNESNTKIVHLFRKIFQNRKHK